MTLPLDIVLVRHGQSEGNKAKRRAEKNDSAAYTQDFLLRHTASYRLTDLGQEQACLVGAHLDTVFPTFDRYYVSEYIRAKETAALMKLRGAEWFTDFNLTERNWGELDLHTPEERDLRYGEVLKRREYEPFFWTPPSGENFAQLCLRLRNVLETWHRECSDKRIIVVCHGEVMWAFRVLLERMSQEKFRELHLSSNPTDRIHNCQIIHYTRRDPYQGRTNKYVAWMRMIRPATPKEAFDISWRAIERKRYSNEDLLAEVERVNRMIA